jgi:hypothetical protein
MRADTTLFQASHGNQPRGWRRWGFQVGGETYFFTAHYSEARRQAFEVARTRGVRVVEVLP